MSIKNRMYFFISVLKSKIFIFLATLFIFFSDDYINDSHNVIISLIKTQENENKQMVVDYYKIPESIPKLYPSLTIITLNPLIIDYQSKKQLTTDIELVISCYEELPNYILKKGLLINYSKFLDETLNNSCDNKGEDITLCQEMKKTHDVINEVLLKIENEFTLKANSCFDSHTKVASAHEIKRNPNDYKSQRTNLTERVIKREKMIFSLRQVTYIENFYLKLRVKYEKYCTNKEKYEEPDILDCRLLLDSCIIFEKRIPVFISLLNKYYSEYLNIKRA